MEAVDYLLLRKTIEGISIKTLKELLRLSNVNDRYGNYIYKKTTNSCILYKQIQDSKKANYILLKCVKEYYSFDEINKYEDSCLAIRNMIEEETNSYCIECINCHKKCIELLEKNKLKRKF